MAVTFDTTLEGIDWHIGLQTDDQQAFYAALGYERQPEFWSLVSGRWLDNEANR